MAKALNLFQKKPYIEGSRCIRCGICVNSCPVPEKAVDFKNGKDHPPVIIIKMYPVFLLPGNVPGKGNKSKVKKIIPEVFSFPV